MTHVAVLQALVDPVQMFPVHALSQCLHSPLAHQGLRTTALDTGPIQINTIPRRVGGLSTHVQLSAVAIPHA